MTFDFDPFSHLDMNFDQVVDATDLEIYELSNENGMDLLDLNHDMAMDQFQSDLNSDGHIDTFQADLNGNGILDQFEFNHMGTNFEYDLNHDDRIDELDMALATTLFPK
ncbi:hypothetical protein [Oceanobacillus salinisoli]|uniref:hypothetical protein n=1 Tax=Oceanobacillus salinisoli TaxID=2678611 RepID=UPI0012E186C9|nr:hypothetical protein [Oceanobacillus salinisoli]